MNPSLARFMIWATGVCGAYLVFLALEGTGNVPTASSITAGVGILLVGVSGVVTGRRQILEQTGEKA